MNTLKRLEVEIDYVNHRGERSIRRIIPIGIRFGSTEYHPELQWLMCANDLTKDDVRTFAMKDIYGWRVPTGAIPDPGPMLFSADSLRLADDLSRGLARKWKDEALAIAKRAGRRTVTADDVRAAIKTREAEDQLPRVCVAAVIRDDEGRILLLKRGTGCSFPGTYCLPGGRVKAGETLFKSCQREVSEETGLEVFGTQFLAVTETLGPPHLIGFVFEARIGEGDVHNAEPETHDDIGWFAMDRLPSPLMPGVVQWLIQTKQAWKTEECP
jgi:ADP-ribose pyrophosphatase YjhB (NUDIX family)